MPNDKASVDPRPAGEDFDPQPANDRRAEPAVKRPNEPGLNREADVETAEPKIEPADDVSEGR